MSANIKIGNDTLQGVDAVELENADALGSYVKFGLGISGGYTVTFVANGSNFEVCSVVAGKSVARPNTPTSEGQFFNGWYTDATGGTEVTFPYTPTQDTTLYARFSDLIIVGVTGLANVNGILTLTDGIEGVGTYTSSQEGNYVSVTNPLSDYFPFNQISEFTDEEGNVFVKYPQLWMKWELDANGNINGYKFSNGNAGEGFFIPDAFLDPKNTTNDTYLPYFALGKYEMSGSSEKGFSKSGQTCLTNVTIGDARGAARAYGNAANLYKGYQQLDFAQCTLYNLMCMMFYGTSNIQRVWGGRSGQGTTWSDASVTGTCDNVTGMNGWNTATSCVKMLGIENPYGNVQQWCDGANFLSQTIYAQRYPQNYGSDGNAMGFNRPSTKGYIKFLKNGTTDKTRSYAYASEIGGSASTYCGDFIWPSGSVLAVGGSWGNIANTGLWYSNGMNNEAQLASFIGARLSYRPIQLNTIQLATPQNVTANGTTVSWDAVENATSYDVYADDTALLGSVTSQQSVDLTTLSGWANLTDGNHTIQIMAKADGYQDSEKSAGVEVTKSASPKTLEESTWAEIAQVSANKSWNAMGWKVGDSKTITLNGTVGTLALDNYQCKVYILGFDHNAEKEGQGISFGMLEGIDGKQLCLVDQYYGTNTAEVMAFTMNTLDTNVGGWKSTKIRSITLGSTDVGVGDATPNAIANPGANTLMAALPADLRKVLKPITKYTDNVGDRATESSAITSSIDYLPLMSEFEVFGVQRNANQNEQTYQAQYEYYNSDKSKIKYRQSEVDTAVGWGLRSPSFGNSVAFCNVGTVGTITNGLADMSFGVAPVFLV